MQPEMMLEAKKEALSELIKMMQDLMVKMESGQEEKPIEEGMEADPMAEEKEMMGEEEGGGAESLEEMVKSEMKKGGKIKPPKSAMLAVSVKSPMMKKSASKRYG